MKILIGNYHFSVTMLSILSYLSLILSLIRPPSLVNSPELRPLLFQTLLGVFCKFVLVWLFRSGCKTWHVCV